MADKTVFVIGYGEVGRRLGDALAGDRVEVVPVGRESGWDRAASGEAGVRLVCVREEALPSVLARLENVDPVSTVFVQNGWIRPLLDRFPGHGRGLIWFTAKGEFFRVLRPSLFSGATADLLVTALTAAGVAAGAVDEQRLAAAEAEKIGFNCVVGLPLAVHGVSLGEYLRGFPAEAQALFEESTAIPAAALGVPADPSWWDAFLAVAPSLEWVRVARAKALGLRNGAVLSLARALGRDAPVTRALLAAAGE